MGACIGKKSSKYAKRDPPKSDNIQAPQPKVQDNVSPNQTSPSSSNNLPATDGLATNTNDNEYRLSKIDDTSINSELQLFLDEQILINEVLARPLMTSIISDTELEFELANLIHESPENTNTESSSLVNTDKSNDVR